MFPFQNQLPFLSALRWFCDKNIMKTMRGHETKQRVNQLQRRDTWREAGRKARLCLPPNAGVEGKGTSSQASAPLQLLLSAESHGQCPQDLMSPEHAPSRWAGDKEGPEMESRKTRQHFSRAPWNLATKERTGTSLVVQWIRIHLPKQETRDQPLVWQDPTCLGATTAVCHSY